MKQKNRLPACFSALLAGYLVVVLAGCSLVGPDYDRVAPETPAGWHASLDGGLAADTDPDTLARWWRTLADPELERLVDRAVQGNLDLAAAKTRLREARALRGISKAALAPTLDASTSATKLRSSANSGLGGESELYAIGFDAGWEIDLFGGRRRAVEAAEADVAARREDLRDVLVSLTAEVARNYVELRTLQDRLATLRDTVATLEKRYDLDRSRYRAGLVDALILQQSRTLLERTRAQVPALETGVAAATNRLAVLLGEKPGALTEELAEPAPIPAPPPTVAVGIPADLLRRRPDLRRAERQLAAATARIGVATADRYPHLRLAGSIGLESLHAEDLLEWLSRTWRIGPAVSWRIFDAGAIRRNIEAATARRDLARVAYEKAVLTALEEVENALVGFAKEQQRWHALQEAATAAAKARDLARQRYEAGLVDYTTVLDAERSLQSLQDEVAASRGAVATALIRLYKALGGGWQPEDFRSRNTAYGTRTSSRYGPAMPCGPAPDEIARTDRS